MKCTKEKFLQAYLDRELRFKKAAGLEKHLAECQTCSRKLKELVSQKEFIKKKLSLLEPSSIPFEKMTSEVRSAFPPLLVPWHGTFFPSSIRLPLAVSVMAILFFLGFFLGLALNGRWNPETKTFEERRAKTIPLYVVAGDSIRALPMSLDLDGYRFLSRPRIFVIQEGIE